MVVPADEVAVFAEVPVADTVIDPVADRAEGGVTATTVHTATDHGIGIIRHEGRASKRGDGGETENDLAGHGSLLGK